MRFQVAVFLLLLSCLLGSRESIAQMAPQSTPQPTMRVVPPKAKQKAENLLDFEAEVIEGEKKRPELFLDIKAGDGNVGSGLYMRPHYDDFFVVDKRRRPRFVKSK